MAGNSLLHIYIFVCVCVKMQPEYVYIFLISLRRVTDIYQTLIALLHHCTNGWFYVCARPANARRRDFARTSVITWVQT